MFDMFLAPEALPFAIALAVTAGLFILEILGSLMGATILGAGSEGVDLDVDIDADFDLSAEFDPEVAELATAELDLDAGDASSAPSDVLGWLGARDVPFLIWLVSFLTMFGLMGLVIQSVASGAFGAPLPASADHAEDGNHRDAGAVSGRPPWHHHPRHRHPRQARRGQDQRPPRQHALPARGAVGR